MWDLGPTDNYVKIAHAEYMGFPKRPAKKKSVIILGGEEKIMEGYIYDC